MSTTSTLMAATAAFALAGNVAGGNANDCIAESTGLRGIKFTNRCTQPLMVYLRADAAPAGTAQWQRLILDAGRTKVVGRNKAMVVACPLQRGGPLNAGLDEEVAGVPLTGATGLGLCPPVAEH